MRIALPHDLGRDEVRRRLKERSHEIADYIPGGLAKVDTNWRSEDRMELGVNAMGQQITGDIEVYDSEVVFQIKLPPALSFVRPMIEGAIRANGTKMLEKN
ncbi:polyhydroxyalkanoic acid system family protein [Altererythrobacter arenosus]|uniref:Polyhydroxyalkanoic acid system family protein n=1 Tax=Altererythrobacter arenosus TaxID=3032592 RepID=A0ABY8FTC4_9SPHN|nr:polyhydroxyalkanoic acid system family protein [Altererythrobacter sp. CAU 1644]WFL78254.1 polyhydroxyalkanoic acid system family protein [Altererythrobacter sp. CAU 1644]